jgi:hypothetical protein
MKVGDKFIINDDTDYISSRWRGHIIEITDIHIVEDDLVDEHGDLVEEAGTYYHVKVIKGPVNSVIGSKDIWIEHVLDNDCRKLSSKSHLPDWW